MQKCTLPEIWNKTIFFVILGHFLPFTLSPLTTQKTKILKKIKKASDNVIILNLCNKKYDQVMYAYSDMECDRHNFFVILGNFLFCLPHY